MARFNAKASGNSTTNICGHAAYALSGRELLASQALTSFVNEPKYYGDNTAEFVRTAEFVADTDGLFVAKLAVYVRTAMNMRSASHVLCAVLAHRVKGERFTRRAIARCVVRGDDVTEIIAAYQALYPGEPLPNSLRRGLRDALDDMGDYGIAKYRMQGRSVTMADAIKLCHPRRREATAACIAGTLAKPCGWETELSAHGNTAETWERLIAEGAVPYMALLRNLRNIVEAGPSNLDVALEHIADPAAVARSRQLPFRFLSASRSLVDVRERWCFWEGDRPLAGSAAGHALDAVERALEASIANCPRLPGRTAVAVDVSGSMGCPISRRSSITYRDIAALLAACIVKTSDDCRVYTFEKVARRVPASPGEPALTIAGRIGGFGGCTNMRAAFDAVSADGADRDRIIVLSDNEVNSDWGWHGDGGGDFGRKCIQSCADAYREQAGRRVWVHAIDLAGYGTTQFEGADTNFMAGWSEKLLQFIPLAEQGVGDLVEAIDRVNLDEDRAIEADAA